MRQPAADPPPRREFLALLGASALASAVPTAADDRGQSPGGLVADPPRDLKPNGSDLGSVLADVERLAGAGQYESSFLTGRFRSLDAFLAHGRRKIFDALLYRPAPVSPRPEVIDRRDCGDHVREKLVFSTTPDFRVPVYVLIPKGLKGPAPAIVDLHSHGGMFLFGKEKVIDLGEGRNHPAMIEYQARNYDGRPTATALVRRGYVVVTIDAFMFGERRTMIDADLGRGWDRSKYTMDDVRTINQHCRAKEETLVKALTFAGLTWPGLVFWDDIRTVDYLASRPEVDPNRIGCLGISMGGYRALYLSALDPRIKAGCVVGFMSTVRPMMHAHLDTHSWVHFLPALHRDLDWPDVASLAAPRHLMVLQCSRDGLFPLSGMKDSVARIAAAYDKAGCAAHFTGRFYDVPHQFARAMQDDAFAWFDRVLA
jgi:dienelactone hydrolase